MNTDHKFVFEVSVFHDNYVDSPVDNDCFKLLSFDASSIYFVDHLPDDLKLEDQDKTWWPLSSRGDRLYLEAGSAFGLPNYPTSRMGMAGILQMASEIAGDNATDMARDFIDQFNDWVNGDCWQYELRRHELVFGACPRCHCGDNVAQFVERTEPRSLSSIIGSDWANTVIVEDILEEIAATKFKKEQVAIWLKDRDHARYIIQDVAANLKTREIPLVHSLD
jgi:hypothetical protein